MKKRLVFAAPAMLFSVSIAFAQTDTPRIDQRQSNQEQRIDQEISSGQLNQNEGNRLDKQQQHIDNMENRAKSDGVVTNTEW